MIGIEVIPTVGDENCVVFRYGKKMSQNGHESVHFRRGFGK